MYPNGMRILDLRRDRYPMVVTEFGFSLGKQGLAENGEYGKEIIRYLESKGISWVCWIFDPLWKPTLIDSWDTFKPTESGEFFRQALQKKLRTDSLYEVR